jgi:ureidoacrylate peracid hydrolase
MCPLSALPLDPHVALRRFWRGFPPARLIPGDAALLLLDVQYLTCHPDFGLGRQMRERALLDVAERYFAAVERMIQNLSRLLEAARAVGMQVAYSHLAAHTIDGRDVPEQMRDLGLFACKGTKEAQILDRVAPQRTDLVLPRTTLSIFTPRTGDQLLRNLGVKTLVIAGTLTDASIASTARDAGDRGYRTVVTEDACAALSLEDHWAALAPVGLWYGHVVTTDVVVAAIRDGSVVAG